MCIWKQNIVKVLIFPVVHEVLRSQTKNSSFDRYILNKNITLNGYNIPNGSLVYANYQYILHEMMQNQQFWQMILHILYYNKIVDLQVFQKF